MSEDDMSDHDASEHGASEPGVANHREAARARAERHWRAAAEKAIGGDVERLTGTSIDGIAIAPLYPRPATDGPRLWRAGAWSVATRVDHPDAQAANALALLDLEGGADSLTIAIAGSPSARGFGLEPGDLAPALDGVELDFIGLRLDAGPNVVAAAAALADLIARRRLTSAALAVDLGFDPIGCQARSGMARSGTARADAGDLARILDLAKVSGLAGRPMLADGRPYHEAGAGEAQELAAVLATGVAYLRILEQTGLSLDQGRDALAFLLAFDADMFLGLAKARALRHLWARVEAACGLVPKPLRLHAETAWRTMTRRDPWTNVMRGTAAAFAAGLGGADVVAVLPFTLALGLPDAPARRLARNVQRVLIDEAHLAKVEDPAAGSGGFDTLTQDLCARAWVLFQAIEAEGGIEASLRSGAFASRIADTARIRSAAFATMKQGIVGTNSFPSLDEVKSIVLDVAPRPASPVTGTALRCRRDAEPFETLRDAADAIATTDGHPRVFLATLGPPASYGRRATYAANIFAASGLNAVVETKRRDVAALAADFRTSGAFAACVCGSETLYQEQAIPMIEALREAGATHILLVGEPNERESALRSAGLAGFVHEGCDMLVLLAETLAAARL